MAKEVEKEVAQETKKENGKFSYSPSVKKEWVHKGPEKTRVDIPVGKDKEGNTIVKQYFVANSFMVEGKDGFYGWFPEKMRHDAITVKEPNAEKSRPATVKEFADDSRRIQTKSLKPKAKKAKEQPEKGKENEGR